ncbi:hypothetical protein ACT8ZR_18290 [Neobacillus sp. M.A.Huq-85]
MTQRAIQYALDVVEGRLHHKINKYKEYYENGYWEGAERLLIIGKINMKLDIDDYPFIIKQIRCIDDLKELIQQYKIKKQSKPKSNIKYLPKE